MFPPEQIGINLMSIEATYLKAILATVARQAFPPDRLAELVTSHVGGEKQIAAFNLCDGTKSQSQIADSVGLDKSNFSKSINRWVELGIAVKIEEGGEVRPVHVYPLARDQRGRKKGKKNGE